MKKIFLLVILVFGFMTLSSDWVEVKSNQDIFVSTSFGLENTEVEFNLPGYEFETVTESGTEYTKLSYAGEGEILEVGKPDLPCFSRLVAISNTGRTTVEIIDYDEEIISNIIVYPQQELQSESQPNRSGFVKDEVFYNNGSIFPEQ
ncbi:MAG: hypothetical protein K9N09_08875, partial [Candidatus Cloacimonetes bacterium]|nr:hypothetical protein [Candidatus Cloacimonadota bacterium]MCF7813955.1 hypothetical protein [Candidatus Cloacimonadota bacterium]MCF7868799.1 hypothetical protein [Candidatus Cloacimonadota bacterium]MCF7884058.1 hypothetical protein [Candidatus Cloacimonadota bacterium]